MFLTNSIIDTHNISWELYRRRSFLILGHRMDYIDNTLLLSSLLHSKEKATIVIELNQLVENHKI